MYPALFLLPLQMLICYTLPNPNGFSKSNFPCYRFPFLCWLFMLDSRQSIWGPLLHFDLNLSKEIASLSRCREILLSPQLMVMSTVIWVFSQLGHGLWRLSPVLGVSVGLGDFCFLPNWWWWGWHQLSGAALKWSELEHPDGCLLGISPVVSLPQVACHRHLWSGASSAGVMVPRNSTKRGKYNLWKSRWSCNKT